MKNVIYIFLFISVSVAAQNSTKVVEETLDNWHLAAAEANYENYFNLMTEDAVFIGTDASENWQLKEHHLKPLSFLGGSIYAQVDNLQNIEFETDERGVLISENAEERERREENPRGAPGARRRLRSVHAGLSHLRRRGVAMLRGCDLFWSAVGLRSAPVRSRLGYRLPDPLRVV